MENSEQKGPGRRMVPLSHRLFGIVGIAALITLLPAGASAEPTRKPVTVASLEALFIYPPKDAPAQTVSFNNARVSAESTGVITDIAVNVGDTIERGDLIARLDCEEYDVSYQRVQAESEAAAAQLRFARSQLDTANKLSSKKNIAQELLDKRRLDFAGAKAEVNRVRAALQNAQRLVDRCELDAPFSGVVVKKFASVGDYAIAGTPIVRLLDNQHIEVAAHVQEQDLSSLQQADGLTFFNRQDRFPVRLRSILPNMDSRLRSFEVRLSFVGPPAAPGATGRLQWKTPTPFIASEYLMQRADRLGVFVLNEDTARFVPIEDAERGRPARPALSESTVIILDGRHALNEGDAVRVVSRLGQQDDKGGD